MALLITFKFAALGAIAHETADTSNAYEVDYLRVREGAQIFQ